MNLIIPLLTYNKNLFSSLFGATNGHYMNIHVVVAPLRLLPKGQSFFAPLETNGKGNGSCPPTVRPKGERTTLP